MRYVVLAIALVATALAAQSFADPITVLNPSFEDGVTDYSAPPDNWGPAGVIYKSPATTGLTTGYTGDYVGQLNTGNGTQVWADQTLAQTFVAGTTYTLTAAIGMRNDRIGAEWYPDSVDWVMHLNAAGVANLGTASGTILNDASHTGFLTTQTIQYVATDADAGKTIQVEFGASSVGKTSPGGTEAYGLISVDNVQLSAMPEPSSIVLLSVGLIGLLAYAWRKRK